MDLHGRAYDQQGTWQFLSAHLSENPGASHSAVDDRESALHLLFWVGLRHLEHNLKDSHSLLDKLRAFDEMYHKPDGCLVGSNHKSLMIQTHFRAIEFDLEPVQKLIKRLSLVFATRYTPMDDDTDDDVDEKDEKQTKLKAFNKLQSCLSQPEWLPTTVRRAAEQLLLHEDDITISDWVDNTCRLTEQAQEQIRSRELVYPLLPTRLWEGYTRSFCTSEPNPVLEKRSSDGDGKSIKEEERKSKRRKNMRPLHFSDRDRFVGLDATVVHLHLYNELSLHLQCPASLYCVNKNEVSNFLNA